MPRRSRFAVTGFTLRLVSLRNDGQPCVFGEESRRVSFEPKTHSAPASGRRPRVRRAAGGPDREFHGGMTTRGRAAARKITALTPSVGEPVTPVGETHMTRKPPRH